MAGNTNTKAEKNKTRNKIEIKERLEKKNMNTVNIGLTDACCK
jgi:hypothetical protein